MVKIEKTQSTRGIDKIMTLTISYLHIVFSHASVIQAHFCSPFGISWCPFVFSCSGWDLCLCWGLLYQPEIMLYKKIWCIHYAGLILGREILLRIIMDLRLRPGHQVLTHQASSEREF